MCANADSSPPCRLTGVVPLSDLGLFQDFHFFFFSVVSSENYPTETLGARERPKRQGISHLLLDSEFPKSLFISAIAFLASPGEDF